MYLVQLLLPLQDNAGVSFPKETFAAVHRELTERFGGVTSYLRSPARGAFEDDKGQVMHDDIVIVEIMCDALDREFWGGYRDQLTRTFKQEELVVRALAFESL